MKEEKKKTEEKPTEGKKERPQNKNLKRDAGPGRPKGKLNFDTRVNMAIEVLALKYVKEHNEKNPGKKIKLEDVDIEGNLFSKYLELAGNGDTKILVDFLDRRHGKAMQPVQVSGQGGGPIGVALLDAEAEYDAWQKKWFPQPEVTGDKKENANKRTRETANSESNKR